MRLIGLLLVAATPLAAPLLGCGGCPHRSTSSTTETAAASATTQEVAAHETPDHVVEVDTPFVVLDADDPIDPGPLTAEAIHHVIAAESADLRRCYERAVSEHEGLQGRLVLALAITAEGAVRSAEVVENDLGDALVTDCFAARARLWHFPASSSEAHVRYPFELRASAEGAPAPAPPTAP